MGWHRARQELSSSACGVAAIRSECVTDHKACARTAKPKHSGGDLLRPTKSTNRLVSHLLPSAPHPHGPPARRQLQPLRRLWRKTRPRSFPLDRVIRQCALLQIRWPISGDRGSSLRLDDLNSVGEPDITTYYTANCHKIPVRSQ